MAARPGEENVATLFADVHYFFADPNVLRPHHRFDKSSYVYLFENATERRARIEIANHPGTENQDAFHGFLDAARVSYSYKHSCMVNLVVGRPSHSHQPNTNEWHLPAFDLRNEARYHYPLHSLDIYFWSPHDALLFVNAIRRVLPPSQVEVRDEPAAPLALTDTTMGAGMGVGMSMAMANAAPPTMMVQMHPAATKTATTVPPPPPPPPLISSVVQQLERVAISNDEQKARLSGENDLNCSDDARATVGSVTPFQQNLQLPQSQQQRQQQQQPASAISKSTAPNSEAFAPMAYNPAAPAAPESVKPREKTPPPDDDGANPLHQAMVRDTVLSPNFAPQNLYSIYHQAPRGMMIPGGVPPPPPPPPPGEGMSPTLPQHLQQQQHVPSPGFSPVPPMHIVQQPHHQQGQPPTHPGFMRAITTPTMGMPASPGITTMMGYATPGIASGAYQAANMAPMALQSPGLPGQQYLYRPGMPVQYPQQHQQQQQQQHQQVPGTPGMPHGYMPGQAPPIVDYSIHQQAYVPTEHELAVKQTSQRPASVASGGKEVANKGKRLEENAARLERGVTGMLKKFEKKFG